MWVNILIPMKVYEYICLKFSALESEEYVTEKINTCKCSPTKNRTWIKSLGNFRFIH